MQRNRVRAGTEAQTLQAIDRLAERDGKPAPVANELKGRLGRSGHFSQARH